MADLSLDFAKTSPTLNDLLVVNNDLVLTTDAAPNAGGTNPVLQDILQTLRFYFGEWFLDNTKGIPWIQQIFVKNPNEAAINAILMNSIMSVKGVISLNTYTFDFNTAARTFKVTFSVTSTAGKIDYSGNIPTTAVSNG